MANRLGYGILATVLGLGMMVTACDDDEDDMTSGEAGAGGEVSGTAGKATAGSSSGGTAGKGGSASGGSDDGGSAGAGEGGNAGATGGEGGMGGAAAGMGGAATAGAGGDGAAGDGAGGAGELTYACNSVSINHKLCSALVAADCSEPIDCADCVQTRAGEREGMAECAACLAEHDKFYQCGIDAFEGGNVSTGIECFDGYADLNDACAEHLFSALDCSNYVIENPCPESWPVE